MIIFIILISVITVLFAKIDADILNTGYRFTNHASRFLLRALVVIGISQTLQQFILGGALFYLLFDYSLNVMRGLPLLYIGETAQIDKFWSRKPWFQLVFKITFLIISLLLNIYAK